MHDRYCVCVDCALNRAISRANAGLLLAGYSLISRLVESEAFKEQGRKLGIRG